MRRLRASVLLLAAPLLVAFAALDPLDDALGTIRPHQLRAHLAFLADDLFEGRAPGTRGGELAAEYIATQFARAGVQRVDGSWFQPVPLIALAPLPERTSASFARGARALSLEYGAHFFAWPAGPDSVATVEGELVFAGYGVDAPPYGWDDFGDRDLTGAILMVLVNDPPAPPEEPLLFEGRAMTYYGRWTYKIEEARRRGAAGVIVVHDPDGAGYGWDVVQTSWSGERLAPAPGVLEADSLEVAAWMTHTAADSVLALGDLTLRELTARAARRAFTPVATGVTVRIEAPARVRSFVSSNVWGMVPGSDPELRDEVVVYTAHYDHLGVGAPVDDDSIYNGAYDNASGVAALIEIAEAFALAQPRPARSVLFLATTAEEAGLLGAQHYVREPAVPLERTVAVLNIDGVNVWGETDDVIALGGERSTLGGVVQRRAAEMGLRSTGDRAPEKGLFYRSDHFPFALAGVPAVKVEHGTAFRGRPAGWGSRQLQVYEAVRYHRPDDEYQPEMNVDGAVQQARLAFAVGFDVAQAAERPRWAEDQPFGP